ncbi:hypothetical protein F5Y18DRAFT_420492 [Xylariaceae sp. FL1019]|nr:hypothetical protein F5Y18DRAFT_420492 [Xylariaceae sp. FL1019]
MSTTASFNFIDTSAQVPGTKSWTKVDADYSSFTRQAVTRPVENLRGRESAFGTDVSGFGVVHSPLPSHLNAKSFEDDAAVRGPYYDDIEKILRRDCEALPSSVEAGKKVHKVVIFDHTIRRRNPESARAPVQHVHVDQTTAAAVARVRRHLPAGEAEELLKPGRRFQLINVWRPIGHPASDHPLGVIDFRTTSPQDFVPVDLLYPQRERADSGTVVDDDDRGKEKRPDESKIGSTEGYEVRGETMSVAPNEKHRFYYVKDMTPDEVFLLKCYDSWGQGEEFGREGLAARTPHTAFEDPATPVDAKPRESIEVRALVFYDE